MDPLLALSFDTQELLNCCQSGRIEVPDCLCLPASQAVVSVVHRACHRRRDFAQWIERRLNLIHHEALANLARRGLEPLGAELLHQPLREVPNLAGMLWALTTCKEPGAACFRVHVRNRLAMAGVESMAAPSVVDA